MDVTFSLIVACDEHRGIGKDNDLPWRLSGDLKYFSEVTTLTEDSALQNAIIMGRKTWESIPESRRPLKGRINIVISRQENYELPEGVHLANSFDEALQIAKKSNAETIFNIGGGQLFLMGINHPNCNRLFITEVYGDFNCDTFLPMIPEYFEQTSSGDVREENGIKYRFTTYEVM